MKHLLEIKNLYEIEVLTNLDSKIKAELLYSLSRDGNKASTSHIKCDNQSPTLI